MTLDYTGKWAGSNLNDGKNINGVYRLMAPIKCTTGIEGQGGKWSSCSMGFSAGGGAGGGWTINKN